MTAGLLHHFFDLGFETAAAPDSAPPPAGSGAPPLKLGPRRSTVKWQIAAWGAMALGIFARQGLILPELEWQAANLSVGAAIASLAVALALFSSMMRWLNRRRRRAGLEHVATPFAFGFFVDLAMVAAIQLPKAMLQP